MNIEFVLTRNLHSMIPSCDWLCSWGEYDDGANVASGETPQEAMMNWLDAYGDTIDKHR